MSEYIAKLKELHAKATPGPWSRDLAGEGVILGKPNETPESRWGRMEYRCGTAICYERTGIARVSKAHAYNPYLDTTGEAKKAVTDAYNADADLIVAMRNALPALIEMAEGYEELKKHVLAVRSYLPTCKEAADYDPSVGIFSAPEEELAALRFIEEMKEDE